MIMAARPYRAMRSSNNSSSNLMPVTLHLRNGRDTTNVRLHHTRSTISNLSKLSTLSKLSNLSILSNPSILSKTLVF